MHARALTPWTALSLAAVILAAIASVSGLIGTPYADETVSWAAQGFGQDVANLALILPAAAIATLVARRGSIGARLIWIGLLVYLVYSYLLYSFFLHFQPTFLVYVATLGASFYALTGAIGSIGADEARAAFAPMPMRRMLGGYLIASGSGFALLWLAEILPATRDGTPLSSAVEAGLWINPVHVLDLAFILPGMILAGVRVWRRQPEAYALAVPLVSFGVAMGAAILAMMVSLYAHGLPFAWPPAVLMTVMVAVGVTLLGALSRPSVGPS